MALARVVLPTLASEADYEWLATLAKAAADRKNYDGSWGEAADWLKLPRSSRWSLMRHRVWGEVIFGGGSLGVWLTCEGELWWMHCVGSYSHTKTSRRVLTQRPANADIDHTNQVARVLSHIALGD